MPGQFLYCQIVSRKRPVSNDARIGLSYTAEKEPFRPFLTQSDSASRKRPFSTRIFFDWILLVLLIVSQVDFIVFVLFLEAVGVREYCCCTAVWQSKIGWQLCQLYLARSSRATRASRSTNLRPGELVALGLAESRQSYARGVALSREPPKLQQA